MSLLDVLTDPAKNDMLFSKSVAQLVQFCGDGKLTNGSSTSNEFRTLLSRAPVAKFENFVNGCLAEKFDQSGYVLQDVVNEIGRRLGFNVDFGSYTGSQTTPAFDGLWRAPDGWHLLVEVKTTDAYRVKLDRLGEFKNKLASSDVIDAARSSHLIVVGRSDTGELEAQVRGSKHAWDMRLVSVDALLWLLSIRERLDDESAVGRITNVLKPEEYTKVDRIIKLVFDTAREVAVTESAPDDDPPAKPPSPTGEPPSGAPAATSLAEQNKMKDLAVTVASKVVGLEFTRTTRSVARAAGGQQLVVVYSKLHQSKQPFRYWAALHPGPLAEIQKAPGFGGLVVACAREGVLVLSREQIAPILSKLWKTERDGGAYFHLVVVPKGGKYLLIGSDLSLDVTQSFRRHPATASD